MSQPTNGFNITTTPTRVADAPGPNGKGSAAGAVGDVQVRTRTIGGPTTYNNKTGLVEPIPGGWSGSEPTTAPATPEAKPAAKEGEADPKTTRREAFKQLEAAKKKEREERKTAKAAEGQKLAKDFLKQGKLVEAAKAMGMSPAEFREYAQNALLTVPTPDAELTPEQKREALDKEYRERLDKVEQGQRALDAATAKYNFTRDQISPVLADKEAFELIHSKGVANIESYIYDFMNSHYQKTGETLKVQDVAETIEAEFAKAADAELSRLAKVKKLAKHFGQQEAEEMIAAEEAGEPAAEVRERTVSAPAARDRFAEPTLENMPEVPTSSRFPAHEARPAGKVAPPKQAAIRREPTSGNHEPQVPFALLSREERMARMRAEAEEQE